VSVLCSPYFVHHSQRNELYFLKGKATAAHFRWPSQECLSLNVVSLTICIRFSTLPPFFHFVDLKPISPTGQAQQQHFLTKHIQQGHGHVAYSRQCKGIRHHVAEEEAVATDTTAMEEEEEEEEEHRPSSS
jgi:hypothetical protein